MGWLDDRIPAAIMPTLPSLSLVEQALASVAPVNAAFMVACQLRDEGMCQSDLYALYDGFRAQHETDVEQIRYDAVLDTMNFISGWCSPSQAFYPTRYPTA